MLVYIYLIADVTNGSPLVLVSLLRSNFNNSVVGFSFRNINNTFVIASAWFDDSKSGSMSFKNKTKLIKIVKNNGKCKLPARTQ